MNHFVEWLNAKPGADITAHFYNCTKADYTTNVIQLLKSDVNVKFITTADGELLFARDASRKIIFNKESKR